LRPRPIHVYMYIYTVFYILINATNTENIVNEHIYISIEAKTASSSSCVWSAARA
jgi:hypothetical protein